ncbi:hypothetical protein F2Q70_00028019 [Brassica cretica]|uniref:Uncharacterized protein n=1 Tax=Brassica cretica TaxID=69181 RepID=A0A8S9LF92_BRACR|nr:hypothetical protein F2Q70_00028019 [Brassica cretica]
MEMVTVEEEVVVENPLGVHVLVMKLVAEGNLLLVVTEMNVIPVAEENHVLAR